MSKKIDSNQVIHHVNIALDRLREAHSEFLPKSTPRVQVIRLEEKRNTIRVITNDSAHPVFCVIRTTTGDMFYPTTLKKAAGNYFSEKRDRILKELAYRYYSVKV